MFSVLSTAVDSVLSLKSFASHSAYFDVEAHAEGFALVMRSTDKSIIGKTDKPDSAELLFNDKTGAPVPFPLVTSADRTALENAALHLVAFYSSDASFSARYAGLGEVARSVLPLAMSIFGAKSRKRNGWKVGSVTAINTLAEKKQAEALSAAAKLLRNKDALMSALQLVTSGSASTTPPELLALISQVMSAVQSGGAMPVVAQTAPQPTPPADALTIADVMQELTTPPDGSAQAYADAITHIATGGAEVEALYVEALEGSEDGTDFLSCVETILGEVASA